MYAYTTSPLVHAQLTLLQFDTTAWPDGLDVGIGSVFNYLVFAILVGVIIEHYKIEK